MSILEHQTLEMKNVLSYRGKMTQPELQAKSLEIEKILKDSGAQKAAPIVTTTFSVDSGANGPVFDTEILISLDKEIDLPAGYVWKPFFLLTNAIMIRHIGSPATMQKTTDALNTFVMENKLTPITSGYNVTVKEAKSFSEIENMEVDIYVGINPNIL